MTKKVTRRIPVGVVAFESYGIERGDRAIIAMTGDVRVGELGYFETGHYYGGAPGVPRNLHTHRWFAFLCDQDATCLGHIEPGGHICLRSRLDRCEGEHGAEPYEARDPDDGAPYPGGVLVKTYGRVVAVERDGVSVDTLLALRGLDEREQATTALEPTRPARLRLVGSRTARDPNVLPSVEKRMQPLTSDQHEEIARLIHSSMDSKAKNPTPTLTYEGRIVVQREVTRLANLGFVRRTKNHSSSFRRALAAWEARIQEGGTLPRVERDGRLAIEHLWRWLHGYVRPQPTAEERQAQLDRWAEEDREHERTHRRALFEDLKGMILDFGSSLLYPCPRDFPGEGLSQGVMVRVNKGAPIKDGELGVVGLGEYIRMDHIHRIDPQRTRVGEDEEIYMNAQIDFIGPVIIPDNVDKATTDEWPDVIGDQE
jgi:hypothetical protein